MKEIHIKWQIYKAPNGKFYGEVTTDDFTIRTRTGHFEDEAKCKKAIRQIINDEIDRIMGK